MKGLRSVSVVAVAALVLALAGATGASAADNLSRTPTVQWLIGKEFSTIRSSGTPLAAGRVEVRFFMSSSSARQPKRPHVAIYAGCNTFGYPFRIRNGRLSIFGNGISTAIGCDGSGDEWLGKRFSSGLIARFRNGTLVLTRPTEKVRFVCRQTNLAHASTSSKAGPLAPVNESWLLGKKFKLAGDRGVPLLALGSFSIRFKLASDDGNSPKKPYYVVDDGCNRWGAYYEIRRGRLVNVAPGWSEQLVCPGSPGAWLSRKFQQGWKINRNNRILYLSQPKQRVELSLRRTRR